MKTRRPSFPMLFPVVLTFVATTISRLDAAQAQQPDTEKVSATQSSGGDTGFFDVYSAYTLLKHKVAVTGFRHNIDRDPKDLDTSNFIGAFAFGLTDRVELFGRLDVQRRVDADALDQSGFYNDEPRIYKGWSTGLGDLTVGAKINLLSEYDDAPVGLAVRGFIKAATADEDEGLGTGKPSGGGHVVLSKNLGMLVESSYYAGFRANASPDSLDLASAFEWGLGASFPRGRSLRGMAELTGSAYGGGGFEQTNPVDLLLGLNYQMDTGLFVSAGWRTNLNFQQPGETASGFNVRVGYHPGVRGHRAPAPPPPPPPTANRPPTVRVTARPPEVEEGGRSTLIAEARDPDGDPLTYAWRAPDGQIDGTGTQVTWTAPTGVEGSYPVTVTVDDGRGGTASDTTSIRVRRRVVKAIEFEDVHFLFDRYDLSEEGRRLLDRAAAQLRESPDLSIEIEGHCCSIGTEEYNLSLGARRADAVKTYLVRSGIDASRLSTISYGESRPGYDNSREVTRRLNRRAHLRVLVVTR